VWYARFEEWWYRLSETVVPDFFPIVARRTVSVLEHFFGRRLASGRTILVTFTSSVLLTTAAFSFGIWLSPGLKAHDWFRELASSQTLLVYALNYFFDHATVICTMILLRKAAESPRLRAGFWILLDVVLAIGLALACGRLLVCVSDLYNPELVENELEMYFLLTTWGREISSPYYHPEVVVAYASTTLILTVGYAAVLVTLLLAKPVAALGKHFALYFMERATEEEELAKFKPFTLLSVLLSVVTIIAVAGAKCATMVGEELVPVAPEKRAFNLGGEVRLEVVKIEEGRFVMGSPLGEHGRDDDESQREVVIKNAFWLGKCEITQRQYEMVVKRNPSVFKGPDRPIEAVSWHDAMYFCDRLNELVGQQMRQTVGEGYEFALPTEKQWEYACRAGTESATAFGESLTYRHAQFNWVYPYRSFWRKEFRKGTAVVGSFSANAWGLHDMHGNVWEWCLDRYETNVSSTDVSASSGTDQDPERAVRGGSWDYDGANCRSANRFKFEPTFLDMNIGFRVCVVLSQEESKAMVHTPAETSDRPPDAQAVVHTLPKTSGGPHDADVRESVRVLERRLDIASVVITALAAEVHKLQRRADDQEEEIAELKRKLAPSAKTKEIAEVIPGDSYEYALALKAIAQERYPDARKLLVVAEEKNQAARTKILMAEARVEFYCENYRRAEELFRQAVDMRIAQESIYLANSLREIFSCAVVLKSLDGDRSGHRGVTGLDVAMKSAFAFYKEHRSTRGVESAAKLKPIILETFCIAREAILAAAIPTALEDPANIKALLLTYESIESKYRILVSDGPVPFMGEF